MAHEPTLHPLHIERATLLALHAMRPARYPALLESAASGTQTGRFDILFAHPQARLTLTPSGELEHPNGERARGDFLSALDRWWASERRSASSDLPFSGGWLLYLGYELAAQVEPRLRLPMPRHGPVAQAIRVPAAIIHDCSADTFVLAIEPGHERLLALTLDDIAASQTALPPAQLLTGAVQEEDPERYLQAVRKALEYIAAGDVYQANLARAWTARLGAGVHPQHVYERLRQTNPGPFCASLVLDGLAVVSSSPERLLEVRDGNIATRPIAGTRPRGANSADDQQLARELHSHPKERAEHVMLIDLERNDLGRVCVAGTVTVDEFMTIESYAHVHHIVSNVRGRLRPDLHPGEVIRAVFPGGTITGCPKVRCMEIIAELEDSPRGAYTGSLGYLNRDGSMDLNILIRTLAIHGRELSLHAGAGIVADSIPERELAETRAKALGVLRALAA